MSVSCRPSLQRAGGAGVETLELGRERLEAVERERVVVGGPRAAQPGLDGRAVALGQVLEHVAFSLKLFLLSTPAGVSVSLRVGGR